LENLTVAYVYGNRQSLRRIYSNFEHLNSLILKDMALFPVSVGAESPLQTPETSAKYKLPQPDHQRKISCQIFSGMKINYRGQVE
jgi:hypothetical protein